MVVIKLNLRLVNMLLVSAVLALLPALPYINLSVLLAPYKCCEMSLKGLLSSVL